jgi:ferritin-like metal-binding protein YciE
MNEQPSELIRWLNDAYMMERSVEQVLMKHVDDAGELRSWRARLERHLDETREHVRSLEHCIHRLGGKTSTVKNVMGEVMGRVQGLATAMYRDEQVKNALAEYATEHFEIACYESLIAAADQLGEQEVVRVCREILAEEEAMAQWIREQLPEITMHFLRSQPVS